MCGISKSAFVLLGVGAIAAGLALTPLAISSARADEKAGLRPGEKKPTKLVAGAKAPEFAPPTWVKGDPVKSFEPGKVYVVEFWATWCPPCLESIPHLTKLQKKFKDNVTVIGMTSFERRGRDGTDNRLAKVEKFVKDQGDKMNYTIAFETDGTIGKAWMEAAEQDGIPAAFIVGGDGKIAWIGSPLDPKMDKQIEAAVKAANPPKN
jgi:thiol-disulfide isomerase/thioredoxin